ncbi:efflux RND transporter periplasmic adaptor subunit [Oceanidesulfovibrio indonesiensis]|uniref:Efflux RND transporter periplasmic adaptor subunit n=1 Tax=Oceanidesulfovibrio indonesiensis TaxID=54767 RepID=A0A7M3MBG4_9BACT|nr:efflux RND transporter periplasmic adaptor subunit [Oceanidesulfovibrio indonesiensis]TVM15031.1 efflux RND transporter periplasmic adaptor subunit [Oceanidesulfovibrio indonesiensis]
MKRSTRILGAVLLLAAVFAVGYFVGSPSRAPEKPATDQPAADGHEDHDHAAAEQPAASGESGGDVVWTCSMHPQIQLPEPGQCPICFMDLIPLTDGDGDGEVVSLRQIRLSSRARTLAEVEVVPVERRAVGLTTRLTGKVAYDETRLAEIAAWVGGRLDTLYVDYTGQQVEGGERLASIYSPDLLSAQAELIQAAETLERLADSRSTLTKQTAQRTLDAARKKLSLLGLSGGQIDAVLRRGTPSDHVTITSTTGGVVIERHVTEGAYVQTGAPLFTVADLSRVWVVLEAYESDLPWIRMGQTVRFATAAHPGETFEGEVVYIDPFVDRSTRTIRVRLEANNEDGRLKPGMFVTAAQRTEAGDDATPLVIPASAPLLTGKRAVVYLQHPDDPGLYYGQEIVLGPRAGDVYIVREGLSEGDLVVAKGAFKIDSAVQIKAKPSMMTPDAGAPAPAGHDHGMHAAGPPGAGTEMEMPDEPAYDVPFEFARQLPVLPQHYAMVEEAVYAARQGAVGVEAVRSAFKDFYDAVCAIDPTSITDQDAALLWKELSMLLRNDSFLGSEAEDVSEAARLFRTFEGHFAELRDAFPLAPPKRAALLQAPPAFRESLTQLFRSYLAMHDALSGDDAEAARAAADELRSLLGRVPADELSGEAADVWQEASGAMQDALDAMEGGDITAMRDSFQPLSDGLTTLITRFGGPDDTPVYEMFCPMAFDNQGGTWLQIQPDVLNPYYGASMLRCGEVRRELAPSEPATGDPMESPASSLLDTPAAFRQALAPIVSAYLGVQLALADDHLPTAREQARVLTLTLPMVDASGLSEAAATIWSDARASLEQGAAAIESSTDIEAARMGFLTLSEGMLTATARLGAGVNRDLYEAFCPMAFGNEGASWVQESEEILNPYFGASMLRCGEIERPLGVR